MESHGEGSTKSTQTERVDFGVDQVLDRVPTQSPSETTEVNHHDSTHSSVLLARCLGHALIGDVVVDEKEDGHVKHGN